MRNHQFRTQTPPRFTEVLSLPDNPVSPAFGFNGNSFSAGRHATNKLKSEACGYESPVQLMLPRILQAYD